MQNLSNMMARVKAEALESALISKGWSLEDLEEQSGVERATLLEIIREKMLAAGPAGQIAEALEIDVEEIFTVRQRRAKRILQEYSEDKRDLETQIERLRMLEEKIGPGSQNLDGMPHAGGFHGSDRTGDTAIRIAELKEDITDLQHNLTDRRGQIKQVIRQIRTADERAVIQARYFDGMEWPDISQMLYGKNKDYRRAERQYINKTYKLHGAAILSMEQFLE